MSHFRCEISVWTVMRLIVCTKWIYAAFLYTCNCNSLPLAKFQAGSIHLSFLWLGESENIRMNEWGAVWESSSSSFSEENHSQSAKRSKWQLIQVGICRESLLHLHYELGAKKTCFTLLPVIFWWGSAENQFSSTPHPAPSWESNGITPLENQGAELKNQGAELSQTGPDCVFNGASRRIMAPLQAVTDECILWCSAGAKALQELLVRSFAGG